MNGQPRERETGRYAFAGDQDRMCTCGHRLGVHTAEPSHECMNGDLGIAHFGATGTPCNCKRFRLSRRKPNAGPSADGGKDA